MSKLVNDLKAIAAFKEDGDLTESEFQRVKSIVLEIATQKLGMEEKKDDATDKASKVDPAIEKESSDAEQKVGDNLKLRFHFTGFGKFCGVPDNPTTHLMKALPEYLKATLDEKYEIDYSSFTVLHVSGETSRAQFDSMYENRSKDRRHVWIHFGVAAGSQMIRVERQAFNEAKFSCPDENGWKPASEPIVAKNGDVTHKFKSLLNVDETAARLQKKAHNCATSDSAGRFVCNWIYYVSLNSTQPNNDISQFIHVPNFDVVSKKDLMLFARDLIMDIQDNLQTSNVSG